MDGAREHNVKQNKLDTERQAQHVFSPEKDNLKVEEEKGTGNRGGRTGTGCMI